MYDGKSFKFGSVEELIAMFVLNLDRQKELMKPFFSVAGPEESQKLMRSYKGLIFPEHKYDEMRYMKRAKGMFEKLRNINLRVAPLKGRMKNVARPVK